MKVSRNKGRPFEGLTRSEDAAHLFDALRSAGVTWDDALETIRLTLGSSKSTIEKYRKSPVKFATDEMARVNQLAVVVKYWRAMIKPKSKLIPRAGRCAILRLVKEMRSRGRELRKQP